MQELDDKALLQEYVERDSGKAFAEIVTRHVNTVYSVALRHSGNPHSAEEITQAVFIILARKARHLNGRVVLSGWLYETSRLTAMTFLRSEIRRTRREQEAHMQSPADESENETWRQIAPLLDAGMAGLSKTDRDAVALRFFDGKSMREVGAALGASEDAAKMRVNRALEKLRNFFTKRGVSSTSAIIAGAISANSVQAAPAALAKNVTAMALTKGAAASGSTLTLIKGALKIMAWSKAKTAIVIGVAMIVAGGSTAVVARHVQERRAGAWETESFNTNIVDVLKKVPPMVQILPAKFPQSKSWAYSGGILDQKLVMVGRTLKNILYEANSTDLPSDRMIFPDDLSSNKYDCVVNLPTGSRQALRDKIAEQFGLVLKLEVIETNVLSLQVRNRNAQGLKLHRGPPDTMESGWLNPDSTFEWNDMAMTNLAKFLEMYLATPVIDHTKLSDRFDIRLKLNMNSFPANWEDHDIDDFRPALSNQLGLELVPGRESIEMLVVEKVKN